MDRMEQIACAERLPVEELAPGVEVRVLVSGTTGARGLSTALTLFHPRAELPYHRHPVSEVIVVLEGRAVVAVDGRRYQLGPLDAIHTPAGSAHAVRNLSPDEPALLHSSFATDAVTREPALEPFTETDRDESAGPEHLVRFAAAPEYELAPRALFRDLFARRMGARGICGGYGLFAPGASLPCHFHGFDESITIVTGSAVCQVAGREYDVSNYDTACVPQGRPHRFLNRSNRPMAMVWVYAGDEPDRTLVDPSQCEGLTS